MSNHNELSHVGVLGMKWGRRKATDKGGGSSKRKKTKIRNFFLGNPQKFIKIMRVNDSVDRKWRSLSKEDKAKWERRTKTALAVVSVTAMASFALQMNELRKYM